MTYKYAQLPCNKVVWGYAYSGAAGIKGGKLRQTPVLGILTLSSTNFNDDIRYPDHVPPEVKSGTSPKYFTPFNADGTPCCSKSVRAWSRNYADTKEEAIRGYNKLITDMAAAAKKQADVFMQDIIGDKPLKLEQGLFLDWETLDGYANVWPVKRFGANIQGEAWRDQEDWGFTLKNLTESMWPAFEKLFAETDTEENYDVEAEWPGQPGCDSELPTEISNKILWDYLNSQNLIPGTSKIKAAYASYAGVAFFLE